MGVESPKTLPLANRSCSSKALGRSSRDEYIFFQKDGEKGKMEDRVALRDRRGASICSVLRRH